MEDLSHFGELIFKIVREQLHNFRFFFPRLGQVIDLVDELQKGRIKVQIPMLGHGLRRTNSNAPENDKGIWCWPKDKKSYITPKKNDWVIVEFVDGKPEMAIYSGIAHNMKDMIPKNYDGKSTTHVLYEDNSQDFYIKFDEKTEKYTIADENGNIIEATIGVSKLLNLLAGTESVVLGDTLDTWITATLLTIFNAHKHDVKNVEPGAATIASETPSSSLTGPSNHLSTKIKVE